MQSPGIRDFGVRRYSSEDRIDSELDQLAVEEPLEIMLCFRRRGMLVRKPISITMRTPGQDQELAVGFLYTEGILHRQKRYRGNRTRPRFVDLGDGCGRP